MNEWVEGWADEWTSKWKGREVEEEGGGYMEEGGELGNTGSRAKPASFSVPDSTLNAIDRQIGLFFGSVAGEILAP